MENLEVKEPDVHDIAMTTAVMTHNCFDDLYKFYAGKSGVMDVCDHIATMAQEFCERWPDSEIKDWETFLENSDYPCADWEEFCIWYVNENKKRFV